METLSSLGLDIVTWVCFKTGNTIALRVYFMLGYSHIRFLKTCVRNWVSQATMATLWILQIKIIL